MEQIKYLDFDMLIEGIEGGYSVRVLSSPAGEASAKFILPFSDLELDNIALQLGRTRRGVRRLESPEMEVARNFGRRLFESVFSQGVRDRLRGSLGSVNRQGQGLRLRLRMAGAPELANLPWEYLYDPSLDRFLVLSVQTPLVRFLEVPQPDRPLTVSPPLNVVVMISNPKDYETLEVEREWDNLKLGLGGLEQRGLVTLNRLEAATLDSLLRKLRTDEYHVFHFIGHGGFDRQAEDGVLVLEDDQGSSRLVSGRFLGTILHDHRSMRLAILNACEGARTSRNDPFAGVAQSLIQQGIPSVIAMQFEITDQAAITFSRELYGAITDGYPVDAALAESRKAIFAQDNDVEWGTPVLYMTSPDGVIFDVLTTELPPPVSKSEVPVQDIDKEKQIDRLYTEALSAFWLEDWEKASQLFRNILTLQPDNAEAASRLSEAERQLGLLTLYTRAQSAEDQADWTEALKVLEELSAIDPNYQDVPRRIERVRQQNQLAGLYGEAQQLHQAGKWQAVISVFAKIDAIDPEFPDPENLRATAEENAADEKRQAELESLYSRAVREMDAKNWESAQELFLQVQGIEPDYQQTMPLLDRVETELSRQATENQQQSKIAELYEEARGLAKNDQWGQVQDKMEEIAKLDPQFSDPDQLADKANQELDKESQQAEQAKKLAALYSEAVQLTQTGKFEEALAKWDQIQAVDTSYPDSQNVYTKAAQGLKEGEKQPKVVTSGFISPTLSIEWSIVIISYGWLLGGLAIAPFFDNKFISLISGTIFGTAVWLGLRFRSKSFNLYHLAGFVLAWISGLFILQAFGGGITWNTVNGAIGGLISAFVIWRALPGLPKARLVFIPIGWAVGCFIGDLIIGSFMDMSPPVASSLGFCAAGLIGGWVTLEAIRKGPLHRPNWLLIGISLSGFIIGISLAQLIFDLFTDFLDDFYYLVFTILGLALIGLIGGISLKAYSRNLRKMALLGALGAVGMLIGVLIWNSIVGFSEYISWHLNESDSLINLCLGIGLGLGLGLFTRRISAVLIFIIVGAVTFLAANFFGMDIDSALLRAATEGAIIGGFIGLAWGYLEEPDSSVSA